MRFNTLFIIIFIVAVSLALVAFGMFIEQGRKTKLDCEPSMICKKIKGGLICNWIDLN